MFNGKPLDKVQKEIQITIKNHHDIYFHNEEMAKQIANDWNGIINKPQNLRFIEDAIPIVLSAGEHYSPYTAVTLQSLLNNSNRKRKYHFIIFEEDFSNETKDLLKNQVSNFSHCTIDFVNTANVFNEIPIAPPNSYLNIGVYLRLLIPYWFDNYKKIIYLDSDLITLTDIAELYDIDILDFCLGAVIDQYNESHLRQRYYTYLSQKASPVFMLLTNWSRYFNAGVLLFNTQKFKDKIHFQDLFRFTIYYSNRYINHWNDQDVLNLLIKNDYYLLPSEWNYQLLKIFKNRSYQPSESNTKIIHFIGDIKPWESNPQIEDDKNILKWQNLAKSVPLFIERHS
jgi:lipopolysaccharide biosynthesis glycosyltransferase